MSRWREAKRRLLRSAKAAERSVAPVDSVRSSKTEELLEVFEGMDAGQLADFQKAMASKAGPVSAPDEPIQRPMLDASFEHPFGWAWAEPMEALGWFSGTPEELATYVGIEASYTGFAVRQVEARIAILHDTYESSDLDSVAERPETEGSASPPQGEDRVTWRALADRFDLQLENADDLPAFENTLLRGLHYGGPHWPAFPPDSGLRASTAATLWPLLVGESGEGDCYFFSSMDWNFEERSQHWDRAVRLWAAMLEPHAPVFFRGRIEQWLADDSASDWTFNNLWPADHAWHIHSDEDLHHTIVGGPESVIDAISNHPELETLAVG